MYCPFCRTQIPDKVSFCPECGANIAQEVASAQGRQAPASQHRAQPKVHVEPAPSARPASWAPEPKAEPVRRPPERTVQITQPASQDRQPADSRQNRAPSQNATPNQNAESETKKGPKKGFIVGIAAAAIIAVIALAVLLLNNSTKPVNPRGVIGGDTYYNELFDFSYTLEEGFAFASEKECNQLFNASVDLGLASDEDAEEASEQIAFDMMGYDPLAGELVGAAVTLVDVPDSLTDEELLENFDEGLVDSLETVGTTNAEHEATTFSIDGVDLPGYTYSADYTESGVTMRIVSSAALVRTEKRIAMLFTWSLKDGRDKELLESISFGLNADDIPTSSDTDDDETDDELPEYQKGTVSGNTYTNEYFGISVTLPEGFVLSDTDTTGSTTSNSLVGDTDSNPFATTITFEVIAASNTTGENLVAISQELTESYARTYTDDQIANFYIDSVINSEAFVSSLEKTGITDAQVDKTTYIINGKEVPGLKESGKIYGFSISIGQAVIVKNNHVLLINVTCFNESRVQELLSIITTT